MTFWTPEDEQFLVDNYPTMSLAQLGEQLKRSVKAVSNHAAKMRKRGVQVVVKEFKQTGRDFTICPRCDTNPRAARPDGRLRGWCKQCEAKQKVAYNNSEAGKAAMDKYQKKLRREESKRNIEARREWKKGDLRYLTKLYASGMPLVDIAVELDRTLASIRGQLPFVFQQDVPRRRPIN